MFAFWRTMARRRVVVSLVDGTAFTGIIWARRGPLLVLRDAQLLAADGPTGVDGEVVIERSRVSWVQVLPGGGA
ncbi:hypothetical protein ACWEN6_25075 [Sphaerisporangium sp. NPDC004334]